ncbi:MAG: hypothetical protein GY754_32195 [bacterium]|nr:hypothetical protein [bacterium]
MPEEKFDLVINRGIEEGFELRSLEKKDFLRETAALLKRPKKIFLGLGNFLEVGDFLRMIDSIFFDKESIKFEQLLDKNNRKISEDGAIPFSFFKLAVYYPDFLLKDIPISCVSAIGEKGRMFPGAMNFVSYIKEFDPMVLSALPYEIAIEFVRRVGLDDQNLISTEYKITEGGNKRDVYAGDIHRFVSGVRKSLEIEKFLSDMNCTEDEVVYIGRGEAGTRTFSSVNSVAFNPSKNIIPESKINLYGSSLESLLILFNFDGELEKYLSSQQVEGFLPSLVVFSHSKEKRDELIELELKHWKLQNNIIGQRIELSGESYESVESELEVSFTGSSINIEEVRKMISERLQRYKDNPQDIVKKIYDIARERYRNFCSV